MVTRQSQAIAGGGQAAHIYRTDGTIEIVWGKFLKLSGEDVLPGLVVEIEL